MVCGTISGGAFAKSVFSPELGCCLSTRIEMFNCQEGHPNVVEPGSGHGPPWSITSLVRMASQS